MRFPALGGPSRSTRPRPVRPWSTSSGTSAERGAAFGGRTGHPTRRRSGLRSRRPAHRLGAALASGRDRAVRLGRAPSVGDRCPPDHGTAHRRRRPVLGGPLPVERDEPRGGRRGDHLPGGGARTCVRDPDARSPGGRGPVPAAVAAGGGVLRLPCGGDRGRPRVPRDRVRGLGMALRRVGATGQAPPRVLSVHGGEAGCRPGRLPGPRGLVQRSALGQGGPHEGDRGSRGRSARLPTLGILRPETGLAARVRRGADPFAGGPEHLRFLLRNSPVRADRRGTRGVPWAGGPSDVVPGPVAGRSGYVARVTSPGETSIRWCGPSGSHRGSAANVAGSVSSWAPALLLANPHPCG